EVKSLLRSAIQSGESWEVAATASTNTAHGNSARPMPAALTSADRLGAGCAVAADALSLMASLIAALRVGLALLRRPMRDIHERRAGHGPAGGGARRCLGTRAPDIIRFFA